MTSRFPPRQHHIGDVALEIRDWTVYHPLYADHKVVDDVSITLHKGECGGHRRADRRRAHGAGHVRVRQGVRHAHLRRAVQGRKPLELHSVSQAIEDGLAYVTEDRKGNGLIVPDSIKHNFTLARPEFISKRGILDKDLEVHKAKELRDLLDVKTPTVEQLVGNLSGGNQQKVLVGKWIFAKPDVLLLDEPTRGIDVARNSRSIRSSTICLAGKAVLMISSELPEILGMCDRIYG
jgi:putative multiple sugar transport system ATP-binding protein